MSLCNRISSKHFIFTTIFRSPWQINNYHHCKIQHEIYLLQPYPFSIVSLKNFRGWPSHQTSSIEHFRIVKLTFIPAQLLSSRSKGDLAPRQITPQSTQRDSFFGYRHGENTRKVKYFLKKVKQSFPVLKQSEI